MCQYVIFDVVLLFYLVQEVFCKVWIIKEQLVFIWCFVGGVLLYKGVEWCNIGVWVNYNYWGFWIGWQVEVIVMFDKYVDFVFFFYVVSEEVGGIIGMGVVFYVVMYYINGDVYFVFDFRL